MWSAAGLRYSTTGLGFLVLFFLVFITCGGDDDDEGRRSSWTFKIKKKGREEEEKKTSCYNVGLFKATPLLDCVSFNYFTLKFLPVKYLKMGNAFINLA